MFSEQPGCHPATVTPVLAGEDVTNNKSGLFEDSGKVSHSGSMKNFRLTEKAKIF